LGHSVRSWKLDQPRRTAFQRVANGPGNAGAVHVAFFYGYDNTDLYETGLQEYGEITLTHASGSASYLSYAAFYSAFQEENLANEGIGSNLSTTEKVGIKSQIIEIAETTVANSESDILNKNHQWNQCVKIWTEQDSVSISLKNNHIKDNLSEKWTPGEDTPSIIQTDSGDIALTEGISPIALELVENMEFIRKEIKSRLMKKKNNIEYGGVILRKTEQAPQKSPKYKVLWINVENPQESTFTFPKFLNENGHIYVPAGTSTGVIPKKADFLNSDNLNRNYEVIATWHSHSFRGDGFPGPNDIDNVERNQMPDVMIHKFLQMLNIIDMESRIIEYPYSRRKR